MDFGTILLCLLISIVIIWFLLKSHENKDLPCDINRSANFLEKEDENTELCFVDGIQFDKESAKNNSKLLVAIKGSVQESNYINPSTGRFKMYKPPQTKRYLVRIKDSTNYADELFDCLDKEEKARFSIRDFESTSKYIDYRFEIDSLDEMYEKLGDKKKIELWPYDFDFREIIDDFEDDFEFEVPAKYLTEEESKKFPAGFLAPINYQEHEIELWDQLKVPRLKEICRENNISIANKKKASLIESLNESEIKYTADIKFPYKLTDDLKAAIQPIVNVYIGELRKNIDRFHPLQIPIIWEQASEVMNADIVGDEIEKILESEYWKEKLREVDYVDYVTMRIN